MTLALDHAQPLELDLVRNFAGAVTNGLEVMPGKTLDAFIIGHEVGLSGASIQGNTGAADLLLVTEDGRLWLIEAKLCRNSECQPNFLFGNQLARYAKSIVELGLAGVHPRLESYLYGRRAIIPPAHLALRLEQARDLQTCLQAWCVSRGIEDPQGEALRLVGLMAAQLSARTLTLAALLDSCTPEIEKWIDENKSERSVAVLLVKEGRARIECNALAPLPDTNGLSPLTLPPFDRIPQSYKPTPRTLPRVLSPQAFSLYGDLLEPRLKTWTDGQWPDVRLSEVASAAFSLDLRGQKGREICLQIGRGHFGGGNTPGAHALKLIINLIWTAEQVYEVWQRDTEVGEVEYRDLENLVKSLTTHAGMLVRGVGGRPIGSDAWWHCVRLKMRGTETARAELVTVREARRKPTNAEEELRQEGYGWPEGDPMEDRQLLAAALGAAEKWLGPPPYTVIPRRQTVRAVPGKQYCR